MKKNSEKIFFYSVVSFAILLRFFLSLVNYDANDDHHEVAVKILEAGRLLNVTDCWQCYHPKLYHLTVAGVFKVFAITDVKTQIITAQMVNFMISLLLLRYLWLFIIKQDWNNKIKLFTFSFIALNPALIAINSMATNDTFVIFFSTLLIYYLWLYLKTPNLKYGILIILLILLSALSKATGIGIFLIAVLILSMKIFTDRDNKPLLFLHLKIVSALIILFMLIIPFAGTYYENYKVKDGDFTSNQVKSPPPHFFERTYDSRPGVISVADAYFTFRFFNLMQNPTITNGESYFMSRTSLWTQLYARTFFMHYEQHPAAWRSVDPLLLTIGRILLLLGLLPIALIIMSLIKHLVSFIKDLLPLKKNALLPDHVFLFFLVFILLSLTHRTYNYRDFAVMKSIYVFPVLISFIFYFGRGLNFLSEKIQQNRIALLSLYSTMTLLFIFSILEVIYLIGQLLPHFLNT